MGRFVAEPVSVPMSDVVWLGNLTLDLMVGALPLVGGAIAGWMLGGLATKLSARRTPAPVALATAALSFAIAPLAETQTNELEDALFQIGCFVLMIGAGSSGWLCAKTWKMAAIIAVGPSALLVLLSPLWRLALACGLLGSCP